MVLSDGSVVLTSKKKPKTKLNIRLCALESYSLPLPEVQFQTAALVRVEVL